MEKRLVGSWQEGQVRGWLREEETDSRRMISHSHPARGEVRPDWTRGWCGIEGKREEPVFCRLPCQDLLLEFRVHREDRRPRKTLVLQTEQVVPW